MGFGVTIHWNFSSTRTGMEPCETNGHAQISFSIWLWRFSVSVGAREEYWTGWPPCIRQLPRQLGKS